MWSPQQTNSPRGSPYYLRRPVPIRGSVASNSSHSPSFFSPTPSTSSHPISSPHSPIQPPRSQFNNNSPIAAASTSSSAQSTNYSNGGFLMKPQLLKKSPFLNFPAGVATSHPTPPTTSKLVQPTVTIAPLPKHQFEKWSTSIQSWSPTPQAPKTPTVPASAPPPLPPKPPRAQFQRAQFQRASLFSPCSDHVFGSPTFGSPAFPTESPLNLSQPPTNYRSPTRASSSLSTCSFSTPIPCSPAFPLDLRSPPPLATPPSTPFQNINGNFFNGQSSRSQPIFRLNPKDRSIVAMTPNDKDLIEATQQLDSMNLVKPNSYQHHHPPRPTINRQAMNSRTSNPGPGPGPSHQTNGAPTPSNMIMETAISGGIFCSDDNKITLHYTKPQRPTQLPPRPPPPAIQPPAPQPPATQPPATKPPFMIHPREPKPDQVFQGLGSRITEGSFSDVLTDKLEENYLRCRTAVMNNQGGLITPLRFLSTLSDRMCINYHSETCQFNNVNGPNDKQFRTEIYFGGFCGVAHALTVGFSSQLAAAHVLERMRIHFREIKQTNYALYPGNKYTRIRDKLHELCTKFNLGELQVTAKDRIRYGGGGGGGGRGGRNFGRGWGRFRGGDLEVKWECSCFVHNLVSTVLSDDQMFGQFLAMRNMFFNFVLPHEVPTMQLKDYFAIGVDCPMFKDIHCSLLLNRPSKEKLEWMDEYGVPISQIDAVLNDPRNNSGYLMGAPMAWKKKQNWRSMDEGENRFVRFREQLDEALEWLQGAFRRNNLVGGARFRQNGGGRGQGGGGQRNGDGGRNVGVGAVAVAVAMETGNGGGDVDAEDLEVQDIFHDACMEVL